MNAVSQELCPMQVNGDTLECVDKFCHIGDMIGSGCDAEEAEDIQRYERTERMMNRWMCGVKLSDGKANVELFSRLALKVFQMLLRA